MSDYWLGLFRAKDAVPAPFFVHQPAVQTLTLGTTTAPVVLDAGNPPQRYAYYSMRLPPGDYKTTVTFTRADRTHSNVGGTVAVLGTEGDMQLESLIRVNDVDFSSKGVSKLSLADESTLIFRLASDFTREHVTLTVDKWPEH